MSSIRHRFHIKPLAVAVLCLFLSIGTLVLVYAADFDSFEPEDGNKSTNIATLSDDSASGLYAIRFGTSPSFQANCIVTPSYCGYPDETNTGVPVGTTLQEVPEDITEGGECWWWRADLGQVMMDDPGCILENVVVHGQVIVRDASQIIRNVRIETDDLNGVRCGWSGDVAHTAGNCVGLLIEDTEIVGVSEFDCQEGMSSGNYTARRLYIHNCQDGFKAGSNTLIEDSYVNDLLFYGEGSETTHNDGIQTLGSQNVTIRHNTIKISDTTGANACIQFNNADGNNSNWLIENNLFDGGGYVFNASPTVADAVVRNNRFTYGHSYGIATSGILVDALWSGNYFDDDGSMLAENNS